MALPLSETLRTTLSRRELLKVGITALGAPALLRGRLQDPWTFAVFSDTHFGIEGHLDRNRAMLAEIGAVAPDLALCAGDVTERGWAEEYDDVERALAGLPYPVHWAPGNHDVRWAPRGLQIFSERVGPPRQVIRHRGCGFVLLDSTVPLSHWGHVGEPQRRWLEAELTALPDGTPLFVFLHHPVWREGVGVDDDAALADLLVRFNTRVVFTGHGHSDRVWERHGITCTMGRGLYQGSWQRVVVDPAADEARLFRHDAERGVESLVVVPLAPATPRPAGGAAGAATSLRAETPRAREPVWRHRLGAGVMSHLLLDGGDLYVGAMDGRLTALRAADGEPLWRAGTEGYLHSSPVLAGDLVVVGSADGAVYAFDRSTGARRWRVPTGGPVYASAAVGKGVVAIASGDGIVYGMGRDDGAVRWRWRLPPGPSAFSQSPAATDGERVYFGAWDRHVYALDLATGAEAWRYQATDRGFYYSAAIAAPALVDGRLYLPSNDNVLHVLDAATGERVWAYSSPGDKVGYSSPRLVGGRVYLGCLGELGEVRCLDARDGRELWTAATGRTIYESSPAVAGEELAIGSVDGTLWILAAADGAITGSYRFPPGHLLASPAAEPGRVYAASFGGELVALPMAGGR